jgi:hypothetical protein
VKGRPGGNGMGQWKEGMCHVVMCSAAVDPLAQ